MAAPVPISLRRLNHATLVDACWDPSIDVPGVDASEEASVRAMGIPSLDICFVVPHLKILPAPQPHTTRTVQAHHRHSAGTPEASLQCRCFTVPHFNILPATQQCSILAASMNDMIQARHTFMLY